MLKTALAGAVALAVIGSSMAAAETNGYRVGAVTPSGFILTSAQVGRLKASLKLTSAQLPYWGAVEAVLHDVIHRQATIDSAVVRRVFAAAGPLLQVLNDDQKQHALVFAQNLGLTTAALAL